MRAAQGFYALDELVPLLDAAPRLRIVLAAETGDSGVENRERLSFVGGSVVDAIERNRTLLHGRDVYAAGPPSMLRTLAHALVHWGVPSERVHFDSFGS